MITIQQRGPSLLVTTGGPTEVATHKYVGLYEYEEGMAIASCVIAAGDDGSEVVYENGSADEIEECRKAAEHVMEYGHQCS